MVMRVNKNRYILQLYLYLQYFFSSRRIREVVDLLINQKIELEDSSVVPEVPWQAKSGF